jgi:uncharacterized protein YdeI (BOF family)
MNARQPVVLALAAMLTFGISGCAGTSDQTASSTEESRTGGLRSETSQDLQEKQKRIDQQNLAERQRLEAGSRQEHQIPPYQENQPIGGQKQGGPADFPQPAFPFVKGELVKMEGEFYTLRDAEGKEIRVHVDKSTQMEKTFQMGDIVEVQRTLPGHALSMKKASTPLASASSSASSGMGTGSGERIIKDSQVTLSGARQAIRGEVIRVEGDQYFVKDGHGNEIRLPFNQNTRMLCGLEKGGAGSLLPAPSASDKPDAKGPQDLALTNEQPGSQVGPGTRSAAADSADKSRCSFKKGEVIEAEVSDMGVATFIKQAGRPQPGQPLP